MSKYCPECQGIIDNEGICTNCGLVLYEQETYVNDIISTEGRVFNGQQEIMSKEERKVKKLERCVEQVIERTKSEINKNDVLGYLRRLEEIGLLHGGRKGEIIVAAVVYLLSREYSDKKEIGNTKGQITFIEVAKAVRTPAREILKIAREIKEKDEEMKEVDLTMDSSYCIYYIVNEVTPANVSKKEKEEIIDIMNICQGLIEESESQAGRKVMSVVGGIYAIVCESYHIRIDRQRLANKCQVKNSTIEQRIREITEQLVKISHKMSGSENIGITNLPRYLTYIIETCVPFLESITCFPLMEHPKQTKMKELAKKRTEQIEEINKILQKYLTIPHEIEQKFTPEQMVISRMIKQGMNQSIIISCKSINDLRRELNIFERRTLEKGRIQTELKKLNEEIITEDDDSINSFHSDEQHTEEKKPKFSSFD
ncbi:hypothetical protein EHI8A_203080 [Entamoeba histolytica HM-1:IMSS-B]|uniref:Uncharacterized protein n=6 Tax=Entamoeba histolytica TaxID=5759 RepID=C4LTR0_ENTH1|nr:hypothetical protein EHI_050350 [Entamoeba histolytica HM-1:IMSS]EAL51172.1 hypothetical protein EHI_050350 [Entamoeba histolytica HM-1:IMSS]EMH76137.1 hypothetical protein EHI8A_203080 [Entamoeba histolytica HM-1:IMSS-B]EMS11058.1 hypothetical protein KM1_135530 [Entamoeba histolytica HM-3:IMSS]GAT91964.1 hypothetical protein CL6EHI_050350 [Entamoeba histolytica]|eukprot:XP_656558.1 hypothetical protein EHI_050350 [Entamoeba histolytica HM-1:IMSS]